MDSSWFRVRTYSQGNDFITSYTMGMEYLMIPSLRLTAEIASSFFTVTLCNCHRKIPRGFREIQRRLQSQCSFGVR